jgi:hypothetical protein
MIAGMEKNLGHCSTGKREELPGFPPAGEDARPYIASCRRYGTFTDSGVSAGL